MVTLTRIFSILLFASFYYSCGPLDPNKQIDQGNVSENIYTNEEIGWTIEIPEGWQVMSRDQLDKNLEQGSEAVEEALGAEIDYSQLKYLISFQKNPFNIFQSSAEKFELTYENEWEENNEKLKEILYETYAQQGIPADTSSSSMKIDDLEFKVFHIKISGADGELLLTQEVYSRYINGYDFSVNINYNNQEDKESMMEVWRNSRFRKVDKALKLKPMP
ncbi:MAG: hypothetical protein AAF696_29225 [Bacteroidota bacterium]